MIKARINFKIDMTDVRIEDVLESYNCVGRWSNVSAGDYGDFSATDSGGTATVDIYGTGSGSEHHERTNLRYGERCDFPLAGRPVPNEIIQPAQLGGPARAIDETQEMSSGTRSRRAPRPSRSTRKEAT